jgi:hypothetical protein
MNRDRFRTLIEGTLGIWRVDAALSFSEIETRCGIVVNGEGVASVGAETQPFGMVWRIQEPGRRDRIHPSIGPALRGLREILRPDRAVGRVLFVSDDGK